MVAEHSDVCAELDQCDEPLKGNGERSCAVLAVLESLMCVEEGQNETEPTKEGEVQVTREGNKAPALGIASGGLSPTGHQKNVALFW